jgi:hypothetical protein
VSEANKQQISLDIAATQLYRCVVLPDFDESGNLPAGIHNCSWDELAERFGRNAHRRQLLAGLRQAITTLKAAGCVTAYIDGSFITAKEFPADFDGCWDRAGVSRALLQQLDPTLLDFSNCRAAQKAKYRGEMFFADIAANSAGAVFLEFFQRDRDGKHKGIVKLDLRSFI